MIDASGGAGGAGGGAGAGAGAAAAAGSGAGGAGTGAGAAPGPFYSDWIKADGTLNADSYSRLPEDVRHFGETLKRYNNADEFVRGMANLHHMATGKGLIPLPPNAPPDAVAARKAMLDSANGVPKEPTGYGITKPEKLPDGVEWNEKRAEALSAWAHKHSVSPAAAKELLGWYMGEVGADAAGQKAYISNFFAEQNKAWTDFVQSQAIPMDRADGLVERGATALGLDLQNKNHQDLLKNAFVRQMALKHALATGEDQYVRGDATSGQAGPEQEMNDIMHNQANPLYAPLYDSAHPQHRMAKEKVDQLARQVSARAATRR